MLAVSEWAVVALNVSIIFLSSDFAFSCFGSLPGCDSIFRCPDFDIDTLVTFIWSQGNLIIFTSVSMYSFPISVGHILSSCHLHAMLTFPVSLQVKQFLEVDYSY
jgi:hypothetical protein